MIQRYVLREHGVILAGPTPNTLIDPILPSELRRAVLELFHGWWAPMLHDPIRLYQPGYQAYAVLTMCCILHTLQHGTVVSKPVAVRSAQEELGDHWAALIDHALAWRNGE